MSQQPLQVELPEELYERLQQVAEENHRSLELVVIESLNALFGKPSDNLNTTLASLSSYSEEQLWAIVSRRLSRAQSERLHELSARQKRMPLTDEEKRELDELLALVDQLMLLRSEALLQLKKRGHDIDLYLKRGT